MRIILAILSKAKPFPVRTIRIYGNKILSWKVLNTMDTDCCVAAFEEAINQWGIPAIFHTD